MGTVRDLLFHILIVEWVYAKVLNGENWESEWQKFDRITLAGIFAVAAAESWDLAMGSLAEAAAARRDDDHVRIKELVQVCACARHGRRARRLGR